MEKKNSKVRVFFRKILIIPIPRFRKLTRKYGKRQIKIGVFATVTVITLVAYVCWLTIYKHESDEDQKLSDEGQDDDVMFGTPFSHKPLNEVYKDEKTFEEYDYNILDEEQKEQAGLLDTEGCKIPIAFIKYRKYLRNRTITKEDTPMCGKRAVFLRKYDDDKVIARIKYQKMRKFTKKNISIECCHQFIVDTVQNPHERDKLLFSNCTQFQDEAIITLQSDFIRVICTEFDKSNTSHIIYEDMYAFSRKIQISKPEIDTETCKLQYNVLIVGMQSMSLPRFLASMPRTVRHFSEDSWLGFRAYNKVADEALPNLLAALTGKNMTSIIKECYAAMDDCNYLFIWQAFKDAGYVTAYGEDNLGSSFKREYAFHKAPTDHFMQPFFLNKQNNRSNKSSLCAGRASSGQQVLDYAVDFANTYKRDSFFGFFWINSFSRDENSRPEDADKRIENFMNQLMYTGILANTFIIFLSAHGLRFGRHRLSIESYYDDRLPMKFVWTPLLFKGKQSMEYKSLAINQGRLTTPYDVYSTLLDIKKISLCSNSSVPAPGGCPQCHSMFKEIGSNRTCQEVEIQEKWCTCHKLYPLTVQDPIGLNSVSAAVSYIQGMTMNIDTQKCWVCAMPSLKNVTRIHFYYDKEDKTKTFYVVAMTMSPSNSTYEALVLRTDRYYIIGKISSISYYQGLETQDFLINTPGCYIPNYAKTFKYNHSVEELRNINDTCGVRYIFIDTIGDDEIKFRMHFITNESISCCYQYISESTMPGHKLKLSYTPCEVFTNNSKASLRQEVITVTCRIENETYKYIYKDTYIILKKSNENNEQFEPDNKLLWNVLMIGLDSMSRTRAFNTMPRTTKYFKEHKWLDFKAYQKVENNTFQNLMSVLTGKRMSRIYPNCTSDLNKCVDIIWKKYKDAGYRTAYGESNLQLETFGSVFKRSPTDHYMRPSIYSRTSYSGEILCTGKKPSGTHLLEYALNFVDSYKINSFFGMFWINTYDSYKNIPELSDTDFVNFFENLNTSGVLKNTFVIFFSDQGISFGKMRYLMESHYDNRLPMLFLWTPVEFRRHYTNKHYNLQVNQKRLITPYDLYITLADILKISINSTEKIQSEGCPQCTSLLVKLSPNRTCTDAGVGEYCCSCHNMSKINTDISLKRAVSSISLVKEHLHKMRSSIETLPCTSCKKLKYQLCSIRR